MKALLTAVCAVGLAPLLFAEAPPAAPPASPAPAAGSSDLVQIVKALGDLTDNLVAAYSMDRPQKGSLVFGKQGEILFANFFGPVDWVYDAGHRCANFAKAGSKIVGGLPDVHKNYTVSTWMRFPVPNGNAVVWDTFQGPLLAVSGGKFTCGKGPGYQTFCEVAPVPTGWHQVAVTSDGKQMCFYLDTVLKGTAAMPVHGNMIGIGAPVSRSDGEAQCDCLDDMLIFNRALTAQEIVAIHAVRLPIHPPTDEEVTAAAKATPVPAAAPVIAAPQVGPVIGGPVIAGGNGLPGMPFGPQGTSVPFGYYKINGLLSPSSNAYNQIVKGLGALSDDFIYGLSMDSPGGLVRLRNVTYTPPTYAASIQWISDEGHQCACFTPPGSVITGDVPIFPEYAGLTVTIWVKLPMPTKNSVIADTREGPLLALKDGAFISGKGESAKTFCTMNPIPDGWHHVAVSYDRSQLSFFFDGVLKGTIPQKTGFLISAIGNSMNAAEPAPCRCLDNLLFFKRALIAPEIATVSALRLPTDPRTGISGTQPKPEAPAVAEIPPDVRKAASDLVTAHDKSLVIVSSEDGPAAGSGFIASYGTATFLFTNAHVAAGVKNPVFRTLDGAKIQVGAAAAAVGHDVVLMQATSAGKPLEITKNCDKDAAIGDDVVVLGNAEGAGVVKTILGKVVGIGPNLVEVDAPFVPGNSGSPIIDLKSGKVIGIATYHKVRTVDPATRKPLAAPEVRRFGYRLDSVKSWQSVNWAAFGAQAGEVERIDKLTSDLRKFLRDLVENSRIIPENITNPLLASRTQAFLADTHGRRSEQDVASAASNLVAALRSISRSDIQTAQAHLTYDYFQRKVADTQREREALIDEIETDSQAIRNTSSDPQRRAGR